jgi:hypothetical protein
MVESDSTSKVLNGKGAFFYFEPVTVDSSNITLDKPPAGVPPRREIRVRTYTENMGRVMVTDDGFVCLFLEDPAAIRLLNTIFASASLLWGIRGYIVRLGELCNFEWVPESQYITITAYVFVERNILSFQRDTAYKVAFDIWRKGARRLVTPSVMEQTINFADWILSYKDLQMDMVLLFDGFTLEYKGAYSAAYLYAWMMIETFLGKIWNEYVDSSNRSTKDKKTLKDHNRWTTYQHIEMLSAVNKMNAATRDLMHKLRHKRNSIVHDRHEVNQGEAHQCLLVADKILRNRFNNPNAPFLNIS